MAKLLLLLFVALLCDSVLCHPLVVNTWAFTNATDKAWDALCQPDKVTKTAALDAVEQVQASTGSAHISSSFSSCTAKARCTAMVHSSQAPTRPCAGLLQL